jgi:hypothetical protein
MILALPVLVWLHERIEALIDPATGAVHDYAAFYPTHQWYLWISTIQWAFAALFTLFTLQAWHAVDGLRGGIGGAEKVREGEKGA